MTIISLFTISSCTVLSVISIISFGLALPTTYDQRQDGAVNVATELKNFLIFIALEGPPGAKPNPDKNDEIASYLALLGDNTADHHSSLKQDYVNSEQTIISNEFSKDPVKADHPITNDEIKDDATDLISDDEDSKETIITAAEAAEQSNDKKSSEKIKTGENESSANGPSAKSARTLWTQVEDVVDNRQGTSSLKKELSWDQDADADAIAQIGAEINAREPASRDHNEVGLITSQRYTLLGDSIDDCGPERIRDSYGICQPQPEK